MAVVSIDLASRRYRDIGIAILKGSVKSVEVELVRPEEHGLSGTPEIKPLVRFCAELAARAGANLIFIDGPQGWRDSRSPIDYMRLCERCTRTPGKTDVPDIVRPASWTRMARFSVALFDRLDEEGWLRFSLQSPKDRFAVESFPTHAWRSLGCAPLPGKDRGPENLEIWSQKLSDLFGTTWRRSPTHDEIQAVVAGVGGLMLQEFGPSGCRIHGREPFRESGTWREGFILSPMWPDHKPPHRGAAESLSGNSSCVCDHREAQNTA